VADCPPIQLPDRFNPSFLALQFSFSNSVRTYVILRIGILRHRHTVKKLIFKGLRPPLMTPKRIRKVRKFFLFTGLASCCIGLLDAGDEMVKALELRGISANSAISQDRVQPPSATAKPSANPSVKPSANPTGNPQAAVFLPVQPKAIAKNPDNASALPQGQAPKAAPAQAQQAQPSARAKLPAAAQPAVANQAAKKAAAHAIAISAGAANDPQQRIAQANPQIASNNWYGSSFPVEGFQEYTSPFGYRYSPYGGYSEEFHYGLDLAAPEGSYIRNWWAGKVVEVSDNSSCGTSVVVESGDWVHVYCHMQGQVESDGNGKYMVDREGGVQITEGQTIAAGTRIGRVGMTGRTTGPHLHWGLKYREQWVDPGLVLRAMYSNQQQQASTVR
jgi:murein DD-endopeptidase MepM/ murein hydrolase activator NlpD